MSDLMGADGWYGPIATGAYTGGKGFLNLLSALRPGSGSTPELRLIKNFAWYLMAMIVLPPLLHDLADQFQRLSPEQKKDVDRERSRLLFKLRHVIGGWVINREPADEGSSGTGVRAFLQAFETDLGEHWIGEGRERRRKSGDQGKRSKARHIEEVLDEVLKFDKKSDGNNTSTPHHNLI